MKFFNIKNKKLFLGVFAALNILTIVFSNAGAFAAVVTDAGIFTDDFGVRWGYRHTYSDTVTVDDPNENIMISYFDRPEDVTEVVVPSLDYVRSKVSGIRPEVDTYFLTEVPFVGTLFTPPAKTEVTSKVTKLDLSQADTIQIKSLSSMLDPETEVEVIFGDVVISEPAGSQGVFEGLTLKLKDLFRVKYFGWYAFRNATFVGDSVNITIHEKQTLGKSVFENTNVVSAVINTADVGAAIFKDCTSLTSLILGDAVENIYGEAFSGTTGLSGPFKFPDNVLSAEYAIFLNSGIESVDLNHVKNVEALAFDSSKVTTVAFGDAESIGYRAFANDNLSGNTNLDLSGTNIKNIGACAFENTGLTSINVEGVQSIDYRAFADNHLTSLYLPKSLKYFNSGYIFAGNNDIKKLTIAYDTSLSGTTNALCWKIDQQVCKGVTDVELIAPYGEDETVPSDHIGFRSSYGNGFDEQYGKQSQYKNVVTSDYFYGFENLENVVIGEGYEFIASGAFMPNIYFMPRPYIANVNSKLKNVTLPSTIKGIGAHAFGFIYTGEGFNINLPEGIKYFGPGAFMGVTELENDVNFEDLEVIADYAFYGTSVHNIVLNNKLKYFGYNSFLYDYNIGDITIDVDYFGNDGNFQNANGNKSIFAVFGDPLPYPASQTNPGADQVFGNVTFTENARTAPPQSWTNVFYQKNYGTIDMSKTGWTEIIPNMFHSVHAKEIILPETITKISDNAFFGAKIDETLVLPDGITYIGYGAFSNANNTADLYIDHIPSALTYVGPGAFYKLSNFDHDVDTKDITYIGGGAFMGTGIKNLILRDKLEHVDYGAFYDIDTLRNVTIDTDIYSTNYGNGMYYMFYGAFGNGHDYGDIVFTDKVKTEPQGGFDHMPSYYPYMFGVNANKIDMSKTGWKTLGASSFQESNIKELILPEGLEALAPSAFYETTVEEEVDMPDSVKTIGDVAFQWSKFKFDQLPSSLETIGEAAFYGAEFTNNPVVPAGVNLIGQSAFNAGDEDVHFDTFTFKNDMDFESTTEQTINSLLYGVDMDKLVVESSMLPMLSEGSSVPEFWGMPMEEVVIINLPEITDTAFDGCSNLETVDLGQDGNLEKIGDAAFSGDEKLKTIKFADSIRDKQVVLGEAAFAGTGFESLGGEKDGFDLSAARFVTPGAYTFGAMPNLVSLSVPAKFNAGIVAPYTFAGDEKLALTNIDYDVEYIGEGAFMGDDNMNSIFIWGNTIIEDDVVYDLSTMADDDEDSTPSETMIINTIPEVTDIYAYTTSDAENYAADREDTEGQFYPLDEVIYITSNKPEVKVNEANDDFEKDDLVIYAMRRDGIILESNNWHEFSKAYPRSESDVVFDIDTIFDKDARVFDTPVAMEKLSFDNENFAEMSYDFTPKDDGEGFIVNLYYSDKYTEKESDTSIIPYEEEPEFVPEVPNTGIFTESGEFVACVTLIPATVVLLAGGAFFVRKRR